VRKILVACAAVAALHLPLAVCAQDGKSAGGSPLARGRYLVVVGGCNDCHTDGYAPSGGVTPEEKWLLGSGPLGFRGPWGTTYAPNLRLTVSKMREDAWVKYAKELKTRPPMPWFNLNAMSEPDLRAMFRFIKILGPVGAPAHAFLPPEKEPKPPYIQWPAPPK
jgi:mono/diheme cytochrome c family protein